MVAFCSVLHICVALSFCDNAINIDAYASDTLSRVTYYG